MPRLTKTQAGLAAALKKQFGASMPDERAALARPSGSALTLTAAECSHLLSLLEDGKRQGWYYGSRDQYWTRHARITDKVMAYIREPNDRVERP